ncbi:nascent polypeptide-associated complex subunit alpha, muscle-specific form-like [Drosophila subpulchrella]|uniref:nascent polypeptide-associated complex subunit alpha, muscle-specific form-like n=1 Tax=Drosophila subpulchrella TaxID=1486046 RepID=UPI0018A13C17|nr:nascent polypeptide-associated complex subunit alpha, muscle-specific form-like [Drosophila subpulchrella]
MVDSRAYPNLAADLPSRSSAPTATPSSHAESVAEATLEFRRKCDARRQSEERRMKEMEESPDWQAQLRAAEVEEQQLWENSGYPPTPRYAAEGSPQWTPARPPTPRFEQPPPQQQPERERRQQHETDPTQQQHIRTDIPAAHVSHSTRTFVAEGVRWRQQTVVWTWPEGPAEETAATEEPRIWEESGPRVSPLDPRTGGRPEHWAPPTPSTGPTTPRTGPSTPMPTGTATVTAEPDEPLERGPWVSPEPVEGGRPPLKRQPSAPKVSEVVARPKLSRTVSAPEGQRWREIAEHECPEGIAEAPAVKEARILGGRRSVRV